MSDDEDPNPKTVKLMISTEGLISLIRDRPCLWDKNDVGYRYRPTREQAWAEVYTEVYPEYVNLKKHMKIKIGQQVSKKWFNVRDAYVKSIKDSFRRPYLYSELLSFINPFIVGGKQNETVFIDEPFEDDSEPWMQEDVFVNIDEPVEKKPKLEIKEASVDVRTASVDVRTASVDVRTASVDVRTDNDNLAAVLTKLLKKEEDEDRTFFASIIPIVKTLSNSAKLEFKTEVMKLLNDVKKKDWKNSESD